jgi:beta-mannosidase
MESHVKRISLNGDWRVQEGIGVEAAENDPLQATVPGCIFTDLMAAGRIPDPFVRMNEAEVQWVSARDWTYSRTFEVDAETLAGDRVELLCNGLDTYATLRINGREVGKADNGFVEHRLDVKDALVEGENRIEIQFESSDRLSGELCQQYGPLPSIFDDNRPYVRKPQYMTGWDWGPRLSGCGIWRDIAVQSHRHARLADWHTSARLAGDDGVVKVAATFERFDDKPLTLVASLLHKGNEIARSEISGAGESLAGDLTVERPLLWWPTGYGDADLYELEVRILCDGEELESRRRRLGFRTLELERTPDDIGESFIFKVNGRRVYCKGTNWIPADSFPHRVTPEKYRTLLQQAVDGNMNMLRVWGGGIYEPDVFFDLCDEMGILVWQDFMFACAEYPDLDWFHASVRDEAEKVVRRLRHHASLALWCGNNENHMGHFNWGWPERFHGEKIYHEVLPEVCERLDADRPYWPGSPYGGPKAIDATHGDAHIWSVWHRSRDYRKYLEDSSRFISEFGFQAFPTMDTVLEFAEPEDLDIDSPVMLAHQRHPEGNKHIREALGMYFPAPGNFEREVLFSQMIQGMVLRYGIEHWRRQKWHNAGTLIWQHNDCWPVASWALIDYALRPKPAYYIVRRAFAPVAITAHRDGDAVVLSGLNDTGQVVTGTLDVERFDLRGEAELIETGTVALETDAATELWRRPVAELEPFDPAGQFLRVTFYSGIHSSDMTCFLVEPREVAYTEPEILVEVSEDPFDAERTVKLTATTFVKGVWLTVPGSNVRFSDNAFDLIPYVTREVVARPGDGPPVDDLKTALKIQHCNPLGG